MKQLTVPELKLFSGEPKTYNEYKHDYAHELTTRKSRERRIEGAVGLGGYRTTNDRSWDRLNRSQERVFPAQKEFHLPIRIPRYIDEIPRLVPVAIPEPIPVPIAVPLPSPPPIGFPPLPLPRTDPALYRHSRVSSINLLRAPTDKYYQMTKQVLSDARHSPHQRNLNIPASTHATTHRVPSHTTTHQRDTFSIKKDPYLSENTVIPQIKVTGDNKNRGIQLTTNANEQKPKQPRNFTTEHLNLSDVPQQTLSNISRGPSPPRMVNEADQTESRMHSEEANDGNIENYSNKQLFKLFKDVLEHERINFEQYRQDHQRDWLGILDYVNRLRREDQQKQLRKKTREWKKRHELPMQQSIVENNSTYSEIVQNDSMLRRDLREIQDRRMRYETRIEEKYAEIDEYDFTLERNLRENQHMDLGEVIRIKNEEMQLYRDCMGSITKLIDRYEKGTTKTGSAAFSYFE